jgi:hypothetical protein
MDFEARPFFIEGETCTWQASILSDELNDLADLPSKKKQSAY